MKTLLLTVLTLITFTSCTKEDLIKPKESKQNTVINPESQVRNYDQLSGTWTCWPWKMDGDIEIIRQIVFTNSTDTEIRMSLFEYRDDLSAPRSSIFQYMNTKRYQEGFDNQWNYTGKYYRGVMTSHGKMKVEQYQYIGGVKTVTMVGEFYKETQS